MSAEAGFLADICDHPADRTVRLIYADWLDEHRSDDPASVGRARFIRLQCELENLDPHDETFIPKEIECKNLLKRFQSSWQRPLPGRGWGWRFRGGFVEEASVTTETFLNGAAEVRRLTPLRSVTLAIQWDFWDALLFGPALAGVEELSLQQDHPVMRSPPSVPTDWARALAACPHVENLRRLNLAWMPVSANDLRLLGESPALGRVEALTLRSQQHMEAGPWAGRLRELFLLGRSPGTLLHVPWRGLDSLYLEGIAMENVAWPGPLRTLSLAGCLGAQDGLAALLARQQSLTFLRLRDCSPNNALVRIVAEARHLTNLHTLDLSDSNLAGRRGEELADVIRRNRLRTLTLERCLLGEDGVVNLVSLPELATVQRLLLSHHSLKTRALTAVLESPHLNNLRDLLLPAHRSVSSDLRKRLRQRFPFVRMHP
jgi:uncharacterized protein (TIGR02996 family)